jgi:hypothetical protein
MEDISKPYTYPIPNKTELSAPIYEDMGEQMPVEEMNEGTPDEEINEDMVIETAPFERAAKISASEDPCENCKDMLCKCPEAPPCRQPPIYDNIDENSILELLESNRIKKPIREIIEEYESDYEGEYNDEKTGELNELNKKVDTLTKLVTEISKGKLTKKKSRRSKKKSTRSKNKSKRSKKLKVSKKTKKKQRSKSLFEEAWTN